MVSIVIVTMGRDSELLDCLESIGKFVRAEHEIILVNNSAERIGKMDDVRVVENGRNLGFARAVNRGIGKASGEWILLLNPDTRFDSDVITPVLEFMKTREKAGICGIQLTFPDGRLQNSIDIIPNLANQFLNRSLLKVLFPKAYPSKRSGYSEPVRVPSVIGAFMMLRRSMLDETGMLDEGFYFYLEETDLCRRAAENGYEVWHLPGQNLVHMQGSTARKRDVARTIEFVRSMHRFFMKHEGPARAGMFVFLSMLKSLIEVITNLPLSFVEGQRKRMIRSASVLLWMIAGMPSGAGLEKAGSSYEKRRAGGYDWFITHGGAIPESDPEKIIENLPEILNRSRTTYVRAGVYDGRRIYLKRYNYKGLKDTFKNLFRKSRALRAMEAALAVESVGLNTPKVIFACEKRVCCILLESFIATAGIQARSLVDIASAGGCPEPLMKNAAHLVRRMHEMGVLHVDLKGENLLVDGEGRIWLIDLDRLKRKRFLGLNDIIKNLSYLNASFVKLVGDDERLRFLDEYMKGNARLMCLKDDIVSGIEAYTAERLEKRY